MVLEPPGLSGRSGASPSRSAAGQRRSSVIWKSGWRTALLLEAGAAALPKRRYRGRPRAPAGRAGPGTTSPAPPVVVVGAGADLVTSEAGGPVCHRRRSNSIATILTAAAALNKTAQRAELVSYFVRARPPIPLHSIRRSGRLPRRSGTAERLRSLLRAVAGALQPDDAELLRGAPVIRRGCRRCFESAAAALSERGRGGSDEPPRRSRLQAAAACLQRSVSRPRRLVNTSTAALRVPGWDCRLCCCRRRHRKR